MRLLPLACLLLPLATASCGDELSVSVKYADGYRPAPASISVLGVFHDGRMSPDWWATVSGPLNLALHTSETCEPVFGERLQRENEDLFVSIDNEVRDSGITQDLIDQLAPRAKGDLILAISVHGTVGQTVNDPRAAAAGRYPTMAMPQRGAGATRGPVGGQVREAPPRGSYVKPVELSATLYSVRRHAPVARLQMSYTGSSAEEAIRRFATEIGAMAPGSTCRGWSTTAPPPAAVAPLLEGP